MKHIVSPRSRTGASRFTVAADCLARIDRVIAAMEVDRSHFAAMYRRQFPTWWLPLISYGKGWQQNLGPDDVVTEGHLDQIQGFAHYLDGKIWEVEAENEDLRSFVRNARAALEDDGSVSGPLRAYRSRLLQEIDRALNDGAIGRMFDYSTASSTSSSRSRRPKRGEPRFGQGSGSSSSAACADAYIEARH